MTYELAKELKEAGYYMPLTDDELSHYQQVEIFDGVACHVPSLSELIEACSGKFFKLTYTPQGWLVQGGEKLTAVAGNTPEEALAKLWLALNKKDGNKES